MVYCSFLVPILGAAPETFPELVPFALRNPIAFTQVHRLTAPGLDFHKYQTT